MVTSCFWSSQKFKSYMSFDHRSNNNFGYLNFIVQYFTNNKLFAYRMIVFSEKMPYVSKKKFSCYRPNSNKFSDQQVYFIADYRDCLCGVMH